jgi:thioredoxin 1
VKLNIDDNPVVASRYDILSIPTVTLFDGGEAKETLLGARPASHFRDKFAAYL